MHLHASTCGPQHWELDEGSILTWSRINSNIDSVRKLAEDSIEMLSDDEDEDSAYETEDGESDADDIDEEEFLQQCEDYELGFEVSTDEEEETLFTTVVTRDMVKDLPGGVMTSVEISAPKLAPRFASYSAGRADRKESRVHHETRWDYEEQLEDLCSGFSATPKVARTYEW